MARGKTGGNKRAFYRNESRKRQNPHIPIVTNIGGIGTNTVRSIFTIKSYLGTGKTTPFRRKVLRAWHKYRKKVEKLMKEGYTFGGKIMDYYYGNFPFSHKTLEFFENFNMRELRKHAYSYKGTYGAWEAWVRWLEEQKRKRQQSAKAVQERKRIQEMIDALDEEEQIPEEEVPEARDIRIQNIIEEERRYLLEVYEYPKMSPSQAEVRTEAIELAKRVIYGAEHLTDAEKDAVIEFWEGQTLYEAMATESTVYRRLFYVGIPYNEGFLSCFMINEDEYRQFRKEYDIVPGMAVGTGTRVMSINEAEDYMEDFM